MRILLRDSDTGEFFKTPALWVHDTDQATVFPDLEHLIEQRNQLTQVHLEMISFDDENRPRLGLRLWRDGQSET